MNPFTRLSVPEPVFNRAIQDIYDKLQRIQGETQAVLTAAASPAASSSPSTIINISGATGTAAGPQYAFIPGLNAIPSNNPTFGAPYAQDGLLIEFTPLETSAGTLYRYAGNPDYTWVGPMLGAQIYDTRANRSGYSAAAYPRVTYFETDTFLVYRSDATNWIYASGVYSRTQAQLAALAAALTANDNGLRVYVSDFVHILQWNGGGAAWIWAYEDSHDAGSGPIMREIAPNPATGWQIYDGSTVSYLKPDGTTANVTLPDLTSAANNAAYAKMGSPNSGPNAAVAPTFTGAGGSTSAVSAGTPAGTNSAPGFTGTPLSGHAHDAPVGTDGTDIFTLPINGTGANYTASRKATGAASAASVASYKTEGVSGGTPAGTVAAPTFTGTALGTHTHTITEAGTISADGEPRNLIRVPYFRR